MAWRARPTRSPPRAAPRRRGRATETGRGAVPRARTAPMSCPWRTARRSSPACPAAAPCRRRAAWRRPGHAARAPLPRRAGRGPRTPRPPAPAGPRRAPRCAPGSMSSAVVRVGHGPAARRLDLEQLELPVLAGASRAHAEERAVVERQARPDVRVQRAHDAILLGRARGGVERAVLRPDLLRVRHALLGL